MKSQNNQVKPAGPRIVWTSSRLLIRLNNYRPAVLALFFAGATLFNTSAASAAMITVINTNDSGPSSLRQALANANNGDTINFDSSLKGKTITLTSGQLNVDKNVTIIGLGAKYLAVDGNGQSRVFYVHGGTVTISDLTIRNGHVANDIGGGIYNDSATLTITNSTLDGNSADYGGGGITNYASNATVATLTITNCTLSGNLADSGGGISNGAFSGGASVTVNNSTISGNSAGYGGGIFIGGGGPMGGSVVTVSNSTISGNKAAYGGGVCNSGSSHSNARLSVNNSTISGNSANGNGGGIYNSFAWLELGSTILKAGTIGENIFNADFGTVTSLGYNLASDNGGGVLTGPGDQINIDPRLGPLRDNGGPTFTHAVLPGSPAINKGNPSFAPPPFFDQRGQGFNRVVSGRIDVGSFEIQSAPTNAHSNTYSSGNADADADSGAYISANTGASPIAER